MRKACVAFLIVVPFLLTFAAMRTDAAAQNRQLEEIKSKIQSEKEELRATKKKEQETLGALYLINRRLNSALDDLDFARSRISQNEKRIKELGYTLKEAEDGLQIKSEELKKKIVEAYKCGRANYLEILFASSTMADFLNRSYYFERAVSSDADLIRDIKQLIKKSRNARDELEGKTLDIKRYARVVEKKKEEINSQADLKRKAYEQLKQRRAYHEKRIAEMERNSVEIERMINRSVVSAGEQPKSTGKMAMPASGRLVSGFGYRRHPIWGGSHFHTGLDFAAPYGTPIKAADSGNIIFSGWWGGYGNAVVINHGQGITTVYGHMARIYVRSGQPIGKGQVLGLVGSTGYSTGPHLHFEVRVSGKPVDPMGWLR